MKITSTMLKKMASLLRKVQPLREKSEHLLKVAEAQHFVLQKVADKRLDPSEVFDEVDRIVKSDLEVEKRAYEMSNRRSATSAFEETISHVPFDNGRTKRGWLLHQGEEVNPVEELLVELREDLYGIPNPLKP